MAVAQAVAGDCCGGGGQSVLVAVVLLVPVPVLASVPGELELDEVPVVEVLGDDAGVLAAAVLVGTPPPLLLSFDVVWLSCPPPHPANMAVLNVMMAQ
ncbi:MAG: hypothetical protein EPO09_15070 [Aquabacterium sp.]|uniref:hypothetical protein n=1 Tax=Aquabacterium sp. TaxID=1872578 RepID=UPI0011FA5A27|nr:hypothetical protein [Aquabacterium sp.]TAK92660.1 MAG: hypothetical protein EPO09_15070 [Aquabacterium sp.]